MISLRSLVPFTAVAVVAFTLSACADGPATPPANGLQPASANFTSSKTVAGKVDARVLLDKAGNAILDLHTGTFVDATNTGTPEGNFSSVTYTVKNGSKTVVSHTVSFSKTTSSYFVHLNLCKSASDDDDDDDGSSSSSSCSAKWVSGYKLSFTASLKGLGSDGKSNGTASGDAAVMSLPDVNLTTSLIAIAGAPNVAATTVPVNVASTFTVDVPNKIISSPLNTDNSGVGVWVSCLVIVDGIPQLPLPNGVYNQYLNKNAYGYLGDPILKIPAGGHTPCQFTLTLPAGSHTIVVNAITIYPGGYDLSNNSTATFTVVSSAGAPDIAPGTLQVDYLDGAGPGSLASKPISAGQTVELDQFITLVSGAAQAGTVTCTASITPPGATSPTIITATAAAIANACKLPYKFAIAGTYTYQVTLSMSPADANLANNTSAVTSIVVAPPPASAIATVGALQYSDPNLAISNRPLDAANAVGDSVYSGDPVTITAPVTLALTNTLAGTFSCKAFDGPTDITASVTWNGPNTFTNVAAGVQTCSYTTTFNDNNVSLNGTTHNPGIAVTVTGLPNNALPGPGVNTAKNISALKNLLRIDVAGVSLQRMVSGSPVPLGITSLNATDTYVAKFHNNDPTHDTAIDCTVLFNGAPASGVNFNTGTGTTNVSVPHGGDAVCTFSYKASTLAAIDWKVIAKPTAASALDVKAVNDTVAGTIAVKSDGKFTDIHATAVSIQQEWHASNSSGTAITDVFTQQAKVEKLALVVIPNDPSGIMGSFTLRGHVTTTGADYGTGSWTVPAMRQRGPLDASASCVTSPIPDNAPDHAQPQPVLRPEIVYSITICADKIDTLPGFQQITVTYAQSLVSTMSSGPFPMFNTQVRFVIDLDFTLLHGTPDHVSGLITLPVPASINPFMNIWTTNNSVSGPTVSTP